MKEWNCGRFALPIGVKTYVMGIVNATPDSFSGDGRLDDLALSHALQMIEDGADMLDIGGESTRPGATPVSVEEELHRVVPLIQALRARKIAIPISVDTSKSVVARAALEAGADVVNDISGATFDGQMFEIAAASSCGLILMHLRGRPQTMGWSRAENQNPAPDADVIAEILEFWHQRLQTAQSVGIALERIAFDAGFGFGKSLQENLEILRRGRELRDFGFPILSATSRKSTIGKILDDAPVEERLWGTAATVALAIAGGADIVRVHDVRAMKDVARVADVVVRA